MNQTNAHDCNVFLIDGGSELAIVDTGSGLSTETLIQNMKCHNFCPSDVKYLLLTHGHADHAGGAYELKKATGAEVVASEYVSNILQNGDEHLSSIRAAKEAEMYPESFVLNSCWVDIITENEQLIEVGNIALKVLSTPGHCNGHLSFYMNDRNNKSLFGGDLVFYEGKVATQYIFDCDVYKLGQSVQQILALDIDILLPGHDNVILNDANKCIERCYEYFKHLQLPPSIL